MITFETLTLPLLVGMFVVAAVLVEVLQVRVPPGAHFPSKWTRWVIPSGVSAAV